jgi:hypothetical protein
MCQTPVIGTWARCCFRRPVSALLSYITSFFGSDFDKSTHRDVEDKPSSQPVSSPDHSTTEKVRHPRNLPYITHSDTPHKSSNDTGPISRKRKSVDDHDSSVRHPRKRSRSPSAGDDSSKVRLGIRTISLDLLAQFVVVAAGHRHTYRLGRSTRD